MTQILNEVATYGPDMAATHFVQLDQRLLRSYLERWQALKKCSDLKDDMNQELFSRLYQATNENEALNEALQNAQLGLDIANKMKRDLRMDIVSQHRELGRCAEEINGLKSQKPYVTVLIDGDGLLFQEHWIAQGIEGGKGAADALRSAIAGICEGYGGDVEVMVKAYANIDGLSRAMQREGAVDDGKLKDFAVGFTQAKASFDFIDVGYGEESAYSKIKETARWNLRNHNCKRVFLGVSHDSTYAPFVQEVLQDEMTRERITILEGCPTVQQLRATGVHISSDLSDTMFRRDKIAPFIRNGHTNEYANGKARKGLYAPPLLSGNNGLSTPSKTSSWATVAAASPPKVTRPFARLMSATRKASKQPGKWNPGPRGLDPPVDVDIEDLRAITKREKGEKYCNNFHIRGSCPTKDSACPFIHDVKPSPQELAAMKLLARSTPCHAGQDCLIEDCIFGHHCPSTREGHCSHPFCKFSIEQHPPNTRFTNKSLKSN